MTELVIDECLYSKKLHSSLQKNLGLQVSYMGDGVSDNYIRNHVYNNGSLLITADRQLCGSLGDRALYFETKAKLNEIIFIVKSWVGDLI